MPARDFYLAAYDIRDHRRRSGALKLVRAYATGGQKSVHEVFLSAGEKRRLIDDMGSVIAPDDRFMLLRLETRSRSLVLGRAQQPADPDYFYVG